MKMFVDLDQYLLTAAGLVPATAVSYIALYWLAKWLAKFTGSSFQFSALAHAGCVVIACAVAPVIALWFVSRPVELMDSSGKSLLVGAIAAFVVVAAAQEYGMKHEAGSQHSSSVRRIISGAAIGGVAGVLSFVGFALALSGSPSSQVQFGLGALVFFVIAGAVLGAFFIRGKRSA